jgi:hypothetical protein
VPLTLGTTAGKLTFKREGVKKMLSVNLIIISTNHTMMFLNFIRSVFGGGGDL